MYLIIYGGHLLKRRKYPYLEAWYKCDQCKRERSPIHTGAWHTGVLILFYFLHLVIKQYNPKTQHVVWAMYLKKLWASNNVIGQNSIFLSLPMQRQLQNIICTFRQPTEWVCGHQPLLRSKILNWMVINDNMLSGRFGDNLGHWFLCTNAMGRRDGMGKLQ